MALYAFIIVLSALAITWVGWQFAVLAAEATIMVKMIRLVIADRFLIFLLPE